MSSQNDAIQGFEEAGAGTTTTARPAAKPAQPDPNAISIVLDNQVSPDLRDTITCRKLGNNEYRIGLKCKNDGPLRSFEADEVVDKVARNMFKLTDVGVDTNRHIVWEESLKHFVLVINVSGKGGI